ncbi:MAG: hypothetical protein H6876_06830 [Hyphomicrobiaceae bacterium]|nr:hypothetical protein [Hyphomicrobiaceae bacterium]
MPKPYKCRTIFARTTSELPVDPDRRTAREIHLRWEQIDFDRGFRLAAGPKTGRKARRSHVAPALAVFAEVLRRVSTSSPPVSILSSCVLICTNREARRQPRVPNSDCVRIHDLRHTSALLYLVPEAASALPIIGKLLGHREAATTQRYAHLDTILRAVLNGRHWRHDRGGTGRRRGTNTRGGALAKNGA